VPEVATIERAIAATGIANRGDALLELARRYLEGQDDAEGQHDTRPQDLAEDQLAEALRRDAGHS
jgi:hypothetical protein